MNIIIFEIHRLWNFWLGLSIPDRGWEIYIPRHDEM
jgi:hypothetical protein